MSDLRVEVKIKNARLYEAIMANGYNSINEFCRLNNLSASCVGRYLNLKESPLRAKPLNGEIWRDYSLKLADLLYCSPEDLWPEQLAELTLDLNFSYQNMSVEKVQDLIESYNEVTLVQIPPPDTQMEQSEIQKLLSNSLDKLRPNQRRVIELRFNLTGEGEHTLKQIADKFNVTSERIRQMEAKALRILRAPSNSAKLKRHLNDDVLMNE